tara:strand:- start:215 stop:601 length:387 start_codon:yes stop_codon:yes gene_type:complete
MTLEKIASQRQIRYGEVIRSLISECLIREDFYDNNFSATSVTVSFVRMSKDLRIANIYFMPLGGAFKTKLLDTLNSNKHVFQKYISSAKIHSKYTPKINFFIDDTFDEAEKISKLLSDKKVSRDLKNE